MSKVEDAEKLWKNFMQMCMKTMEGQDKLQNEQLAELLKKQTQEPQRVVPNFIEPRYEFRGFFTAAELYRLGMFLSYVNNEKRQVPEKKEEIK